MLERLKRPPEQSQIMERTHEESKDLSSSSSSSDDSSSSESENEEKVVSDLERGVEAKTKTLAEIRA